ncbi:AsnC family transcriptional regulator [Leucobacter chinensis]|uniref:AsnC family transcriptional regulator n=1 Tax=Leucobacter chinensis TaxID=2851010 RepID=UPI001C23927B|nr:AsnC family transcriptional regulator [Leucobacter chinensis]
MTDVFDETDRAISAALLRNGRASWRLISTVTGIQERTVARRGAKLIESGRVRVHALSQSHPIGRGEGHFAKIFCPPSHLRSLAQWFASRPEPLWVATLVSESAIISECYFQPEQRPAFIEHDLAEFPVTNYSFSNIDRYHRTVRGWHPNALSAEQLDQLGESEERALASANDMLGDGAHTPDLVDYEIVKILTSDGRLPIEAIAAELGITKPTVRRRITQLQQSDFLSIRAIIDPAFFGLPLEVLVTIDTKITDLSWIGSKVAEEWRVRWAAEVPATSQVQALLTFESRHEMYATLRTLETRLGDKAHRITAHSLLTHYKRSDVVLNPAHPPAR